MPNRLRRTPLRGWLLAGVIGGVLSTGCRVEEPPSPDSEQYKEAKKRANEVRAKEYGRKSIDDKKATVNLPATKSKRR